MRYSVILTCHRTAFQLAVSTLNPRIFYYSAKSISTIQNPIYWHFTCGWTLLGTPSICCCTDLQNFHLLEVQCHCTAKKQYFNSQLCLQDNVDRTSATVGRALLPNLPQVRWNGFLINCCSKELVDSLATVRDPRLMTCDQSYSDRALFQNAYLK